MTEITRVPIQPVAKGSLTKLWIGVILAVLVGAGLAWAAVPRGLDVDVVQAGTGPTPKPGEVIFVKYTGKLAADGSVFQDAQESPFPVQGLFPEGTPLLFEEGQIIPGFYEGLKNVQKGGKYTIFIPAELGYGATPPQGSSIPANADLEFDIEVTGIMTRAAVERNFQILQQQMQAQMGGPQGGAGGAPGGAGGAAPDGAPQAAPGQ
ncbi:FKBP-type peptidyl-prolyl cis-trans isomerase [Erythrobacter donghaensis]|jgi:FKBP-type peptidyl-prolyl cis-trans isomerase FkpA|uniref:FKBP-type peptidyl-prolyl cis-trans isomerase n=1 Tax=Erythrobacter donghaensis TaxID=267135 RepID=UPI00093BD99F|nr:FKBP-type peptidyl-prolyl cis-trans isomerase [Erythrobacter donghaensis]